MAKDKTKSTNEAENRPVAPENKKAESVPDFKPEEFAGTAPPVSESAQLSEKEEINNALTKANEEETSLATSSEMEDMFGKPEIPLGSLPPQIKVLKDAKMFQVGGETVAEIIGNIIFLQRHQVYYEGDYDPKEPAPPTCRSIKGIVPDSGTEIQSEYCSNCPKNKFDKERGRHGCRGRVLLYILIQDNAFPCILDLSATNLSKKAGDMSIMNWAATASNFAKKNGAAPYWQPVVAKMTLKEIEFTNGPASVLQCEAVSVLTSRDELTALGTMKKHIDKEYALIAGELAQQAMGDNHGEKAVDDDMPI